MDSLIKNTGQADILIIPKKSKKTNATPHFDLQVKEKNENISIY